MDLQRVEIELKKRLSYPYKWGRKQSDDWDVATDFVYKTYSFDVFLKKTENFNQKMKNYALNRWYNFWSAMAIENIFCAHKNVVANKNKYDKLIDFQINTIPFDHKTSVFPKGFQQDVDYAQNNEKELIEWLYKNQSQGRRKHYKNRLFIILYDKKDLKHWKLKAEIDLLKKEIDSYIKNFSEENLFVLDFGQGKVYSDIVWVS